MLHPGVGSEDEERGHDRAQAHHADGHGMRQRGQPVPAEQPQSDERGLSEEREQPLHGQRGAEDVAHEDRVVRPVHAELELLHDAGDDAHGEVDQEQRAEETRELLPDLVPAPVGQDLHHRHQQGQADRERDEQEVIGDRDAELLAVQQHLHELIRSPAERAATSSVRLVLTKESRSGPLRPRAGRAPAQGNVYSIV
jgi:hypothetical protein